MTPEELDTLVEAATTAFRHRSPTGGAQYHPAWYDLDDEGRRELFEATARSRRLEAALDPDGLSTTGRAVLARIQNR